MLKKIAFSFIFVFLVIGFISDTHAQESEEIPSVTVFPQNPDPNKLITLQNTYFGQLEEYRNQEQKYLVAKNQYLKLNTLASQELAVTETRRLLSLRAEVFLTYANILSEQLEQSKGIPLENKTPEQVVLTVLKEKIQIHKNAIESAQDRFAVDTESTNFEPTVVELQSHTYYILSLIKLGNMQIAVDKLTLARNAVLEYVKNQPLSTAVRAEKERGFSEINRNMQTIDLLFSPIKQKVYTSPGRRSLSEYSQLTSQLGPVYSQINQVIQFLEEVRD